MRYGKVDNQSQVLVLVVCKEPMVVLEIFVFMVFFVVLTNSQFQILVVPEAVMLLVHFFVLVVHRNPQWP